MDVLGIDVGGTTIAAARAGRDGGVLAERDVPTPERRGDAVVTAIAEVARELRSTDTAALGVVVPGVLRDGHVAFAANLGWADVPLRDRLAELVGLPIAIEHDVASAALVEADAPDVLYLSLGTGIAAAHVAGGRVEPGATARAGELGHVPVRPDGERCACGQFACLEVYASAAGIARRYAAAAGEQRSAREIVARLGGDGIADTVWHDAVESLAFALAHEVLVRDPGAIVVGGGLSGAGEALLQPLRAALQRRLAWRDAPTLRIARHGSRSGRAAAIALAWQLAAAARQPVGIGEGA